MTKKCIEKLLFYYFKIVFLDLRSAPLRFHIGI